MFALYLFFLSSRVPIRECRMRRIMGWATAIIAINELALPMSAQRPRMKPIHHAIATHLPLINTSPRRGD